MDPIALIETNKRIRADDEGTIVENSGAIMSFPSSFVNFTAHYHNPVYSKDAHAYLCDTAFPTSSANSTMDMDMDEADIDLLKRVTTSIRGFDSLSIAENITFVPVLEARSAIGVGSEMDKDETGHRRDTVPIANAIADHHGVMMNGAKSAVFQFLEEHEGEDTNAATKINNALWQFLKKRAHGVIVRINPGTLSFRSQKKCDDMLRELSDVGVIILTHPDIMKTLGAKDSLVRIKDLKCGLTDTEVYYNPQDLRAKFPKSIAFRPRVIKQNRGSQGEGIWIVKLKDESSYCQNYGDAVASLETELVLTEAVDNHVEYHTVANFMEWCINGRTTNHTEVWTSTGDGRYFDGGVEAGAMLVDQRFLPRIVEGEVRCLLIGSDLIEIIHKKPKDGGISATLKSGAVYTRYTPNDIKFTKLVQNLDTDLPKIMEKFGYEDRPLPLLWTVDYIYGDADDDLYAGEINCSCIGITQQLELAPVVAKVALEMVLSSYYKMT